MSRVTITYNVSVIILVVVVVVVNLNDGKDVCTFINYFFFFLSFKDDDKKIINPGNKKKKKKSVWLPEGEKERERAKFQRPSEGNQATILIID